MPAKPDRAVIRAFLRAELANGDLPAKEVEARARTAGLLAEDLALSQCMPFRTAANKLHILRYREDDHWRWRLPQRKAEAVSKVIEPAPKEAITKPPPPEDPAAARREFMKRTRAWFASEDFRLAIQEANREADAIINEEYARRGLQRG
jgi:hypothetical protein